MKLTFTLLSAMIGLAGCSSEPPQQAPAAPTEIADDAFVTTESGLKYHDLKVGSGTEAASGGNVTVHYTGWLQSGKKFDSSVDKQRPFSFSLGAGEVIDGWDQGVAGMRVGGKRQLIVPSSLAYGDGGYPPIIPAKATLIFEVDLLSVD